MELLPLPLSPSMLERYRLAGRRKLRPDFLGGHLVRRKGQSLEFREYEHYMPGDDIRHVDWRASARYGQPRDLLVRSFVAEEQLTLVISIDSRDTMRLPQEMPKLQIAAWLAEAIARVALQDGDRVILHRLFGKGPGGAASLRGVHARGRVRPALAKICETQENDESNIGVLRRWMPPTAVWLILSDLYFPQDEASRGLARSVISAHDGMRWVMLMDLDSWPYERQLLGLGARRLEGPGLSVAQPLFEISEGALAEVAQSIDDHKSHFLNQARAGRCDLITWPWPQDPPLAADVFFKQHFLADGTLQRLFMRDKA